jgi:PAS domain S-box-containing protein
MDLSTALLEAIHHTNEGVTLADPLQSDTPLIYVNDAFCQMTGYEREEVLGKNCRFLQGEATAQDVIKAIHQHLSQQTAGTFELINYRKDGSTFWNRLSLTPIKMGNGQPFIVGIQSDISVEKAAVDLLHQHHHHLLQAIGHVSTDVRTMIKDLQQNDTQTPHDNNGAQLKQLSHQLSLILTMIENDSAEILDFVKTHQD